MAKETKLGLMLIGGLLVMFAGLLAYRLQSGGDPDESLSDKVKDEAAALLAGEKALVNNVKAKFASGPSQPLEESREGAGLAGSEGGAEHHGHKEKAWNHAGRSSSGETGEDGNLEPRANYMPDPTAAAASDQYGRRYAPPADANGNAPANLADSNVPGGMPRENSGVQGGNNFDPFQRGQAAVVATEEAANRLQRSPTEVQLAPTTDVYGRQVEGGQYPPAQNGPMRPPEGMAGAADPYGNQPAQSNGEHHRRHHNPGTAAAPPVTDIADRYSPRREGEGAASGEVTPSAGQYDIYGRDIGAQNAAPLAGASDADARYGQPRRPDAELPSRESREAREAREAGLDQPPTEPLPEERPDTFSRAASRRRHSGEETYTIVPNDNFWVISEKVYGSGSYFKAIEEHNRDRIPSSDRMTVGEVISTPPVKFLEEKYPDLCPKARQVPDPQTMLQASARTQGGRVYKVHEGDSLFDIARYQLGKASRWSEIYKLNRDKLGDDFDYLPPGIELVLPDNRTMDEPLTTQAKTPYTR
jgi:nucleoid-associated protein YgaU